MSKCKQRVETGAFKRKSERTGQERVCNINKEEKAGRKKENTKR